MTKAQIIETILAAEKRAWAQYQTVKQDADTGLYGDVANQLEKTARTRWATLYQLTEDLKIA